MKRADRMRTRACKKPLPLPELSPAKIREVLSRIDKTTGHGPNGDCWIWTGPVNSGGYGTLTVGKEWPHIRASRVAYFLEYGVDPFPDWVLHKCDYPLCVRGSHLFKGTPKDNTKDAISKGRMAAGEKNGCAKLTTDIIVEIRRRRITEQVLIRVLADEYRVARSMISRIVRGQRWGHIPGHTNGQRVEAVRA